LSDHALGQDESLLIRAARDFSRAELLDRDRQWDRGDGCVTDVLPQLSEMGLLALMTPEEVDGLGCSYRTYSAILQEIAYASPSTAVTISVHNMVGLVVDRFADPSLRRSWLELWGDAKNFGAFAISEANAGSDPGASLTKADRNGDNFILSGEKMWITNGLTARWFVTLARTLPGEGKAGLSLLMVDGDSNGIDRAPIHGKMGIRGSETAVIAFDGVVVPTTHLLGEEGAGLSASLAALDGGRIGIAAQAAGIAQACLDEMISYAHEREQFGTKIAGFPAIQQMIADSHVELAAAKELIDFAAWSKDMGHDDRSASSKAKLYATEAANRIAYRAVQLHGGMGYVNECRVEQLFRDARITTIYEGTSEIQRVVIARELLKNN